METSAWNILITEPEDYSPHALEIYGRLGTVSYLPALGISLEKAIATTQVLVVRLRYDINSVLLSKALQLKYILSPTTGTDHIDEAICRDRGVEIISLQGEKDFLDAVPSTAEFTWGLLLSLTRRIPAAAEHAAMGGWNRNLFKGHNLYGKTLGILGLGIVGRQVARFAAAFNMKVMAFDPYTSNWVRGVKKASSAIQLFSNSNILCIHIPVKGNDTFVSEALMEKLPPDALLINTSRGSVWDEAAVGRLLASGRLAGVATDVLTREMNPNTRRHSPLLALAPFHENLIITPHLAGATYESMLAAEDFIAEKLMGRIGKPDAHLL